VNLVDLCGGLDRALYTVDVHAEQLLPLCPALDVARPRQACVEALRGLAALYGHALRRAPCTDSLFKAVDHVVDVVAVTAELDLSFTDRAVGYAMDFNDAAEDLWNLATAQGTCVFRPDEEFAA
jgi:hypothetical protein